MVVVRPVHTVREGRYERRVGREAKHLREGVMEERGVVSGALLVDGITCPEEGRWGEEWDEGEQAMI